MFFVSICLVKRYLGKLRDKGSELHRRKIVFGRAALSHVSGRPGQVEADLDKIALPAHAHEINPLQPVSPATDVYPLGLVAYEMPTGNHAYPENSPLACALKKLSPDDPAPSGLGELPPRWAAAIERCVRRDPSQWFPRPVDFFDALSNDSRQSRHSVLSRRTLLTASLALVCGLGLAAIAAVKSWLPFGALHMTSLAVLPFDNLSGDPQAVYFSDGVSEELTHAMTSYRN
jgi:hypothetical protein